MKKMFYKAYIIQFIIMIPITFLWNGYKNTSYNFSNYIIIGWCMLLIAACTAMICSTMQLTYKALDENTEGYVLSGVSLLIINGICLSFLLYALSK